MSNNHTKVNFTNPSQVTGLTSAKGDIITGDASGGLTSKSIGANDTVLTADSTQPGGIKWATASGGGSVDILIRGNDPGTGLLSGESLIAYNTQILPSVSSPITTSVTVNGANNTFTLPAPVGDVAIYNVKVTTSINQNDLNISSGDGSSETQEATLTASNAKFDDNFGEVVAISGDNVIVGASQADPVGSISGSAYIYNRNQGGTDNWGEVAVLVASDAAAFDSFGSAVSISGN